jgi:crotonobetainyl-CoA:carnitine CoA-transferase CaiB-like acyl-CoA transferase
MSSVQAVGGLMAVTGEEGGRPEFSRVPSRIDGSSDRRDVDTRGAASPRRDGSGQSIDLSLIEVMADPLRSHLPQVLDGETRGFRLGCRHSIAAPGTRTTHATAGWSDLLGKRRAVASAAGSRRTRRSSQTTSDSQRARCGASIAEVDEIVQSWVGPARESPPAVAAIEVIELPAGPAQSIEQVVADEVPAAAGYGGAGPAMRRGTVFVAKAMPCG